MTQCHSCGSPMGVEPSSFPGFNLLACTGCGKPIKLLPINGPRPSGKPLGRAEHNRAMRSARRRAMRRAR